MAGIDDLLLPLPAHAVVNWVALVEVAGVDVASHPQRVLLVEAFLAGRLEAAREQVALAVAEDHVGDDLLVPGVFLDLGARHEEALRSDHLLRALQPFVHEAVPGAVREDVLPADAEHVLGEDARHYS